MLWLFLTFLFGVVTGVVLVGAGVWYILSFFFQDDKAKGIVGVPKEPTSATFQLPPVLITKISDESCKSKESCWALNFVLYFLFRELRNSEGIRRWVLRKLSLEFEELLVQTVLGKFFSNITIQNVDVGENFPVLSWIKTTKVELHPVFKNIATLDILVDLDYAGGFQFAIQAETHLRHSAYLSVQFNGVKGQARLQFTTEPYAHWSFSFAENPDIDISVVSQLYGKSFSHITSIIASQLKRSVRKKHTLPMYKIRYKPFFSRVEPIIAALVPNSAPRAEIKGNLTVTLIECRGLMSSLLAGNIYATLALGDFDWVAVYLDENNGTIPIVRDVVYLKTGRRETNLDFTLAMVNDIPIVESLYTKAESTTRQHLEFEVGDEILAVDGKKVTSIKNCIKNFKYSTSMKVVWRIRRKHYSINLPTVDESLVPEEHVAATITSASNELPQPQLQSSTNNLISTACAIAAIGGHHSPHATSLIPPEISVSNPTDDNTAAKKEKMELPIPSASSNSNISDNSNPAPIRRSSSAQELNVSATADSSFNSTLENENAFPASDLRERSKDGYGFRNSLHDNRHCHVVRTADLPCCKDPIFTESFSLKVEESHRFLNLGMWSAKGSNSMDLGNSPLSSSPTSSPSKRSKTFIANLESITFNNDRLIGTMSIPIADVVAECSNTGVGYFVKDYYLRSPDGSAAEAKDNLITTHSGFEPHMCYGKISLSFLFKPEEDPSKRRDSLESLTATASIEIATDALSENNLSPTEEYHQIHQFTRTNFRNATVCDYCNKKIWLKDAFACRICFMKCHKKCNDRCIANTICRGEGFYPSISNLRSFSQSMTPEIITTADQDPLEDSSSEAASVSNYSSSSLQPTLQTNGVRRRTLGGLIVSVVQNRSAQLNLRRAGSASNLLSPNSHSSSTSKSLPPSPKASPTTSRKASTSPQLMEVNPFEVLNAGGFGSPEEDISAAVEHLILNPNDDLVAMAKETGRDVYSDVSLTERKQKLNHVLNHLQEEIDEMSSKRMKLSRDEVGAAEQITKYEERVQALALLMLYYCSGLQQVQDLEEIEKDNRQLIMDEEEEESV